MLESASSPKLYTSPHSAQTAHRSSPRPQANTHSPRLRSKKSSTSSDSPRTTSPVAPQSASSLVSQSSFPQQNQQQIQESSKPETTDHGTQYTPPDWPPTSTRSSLRKLSEVQLSSAISTDPPHPSTTAIVAPSAVSTAPPPAEPDPRLTPPPLATSSHDGTSSSSAEPRSTSQSQPLHPATAAATVRRNHAAISTSSTRTNSPSTSQRSSKPKRPRSQHHGAKKLMPANYAECDPKALASLIADMLMELIRFNDDIPMGNNHLTRFHSRAPPGISVHDYLARLTHHATLIPPILLSMVYYIDKLCLLYPAFTINSLTVHRFLITAATVASKGLSDSFWTNNTYARVGGVTIKELALLELEFLERVQWRIVPKPEALVEYYGNLVERSADWALQRSDDEVEGEEGRREAGDEDDEEISDEDMSDSVEDEDEEEAEDVTSRRGGPEPMDTGNAAEA